MNPKTLNAQEQQIYNRSNVTPFQGSVDEPMRLIAAESAIQLQTTLLKNSISYVQSVSGSLILKTTLNNILETLVKITDSDRGSIFLIDEEGLIVESILARGPVTRDIKDSLISRVLDDGLAGWALRHRQIGLIHDAIVDDRWLQLPDQPYGARSALAVPLIYGIDAIGIITLTHSQPNHFDDAIATTLQFSIENITSIIVNAQLHAEYRPMGL